MSDRRNPYFILGLDYGASPQQAQVAFAKLSRRLRRGAEDHYGIEDATWALHEIEHADTDPHTSLGTFRVPADQDAYGYPADTGVLSLSPQNLPRRTPDSDAEMVRLRATVIDELGAAAMDAAAAKLDQMFVRG